MQIAKLNSKKDPHQFSLNGKIYLEWVAIDGMNRATPGEAAQSPRP